MGRLTFDDFLKECAAQSAKLTMDLTADLRRGLDEALARCQEAERERDKLIEGYVFQHSRLYLTGSPDAPCWEWRFGGEFGFVATKELAVAAVRRAAGLDREAITEGADHG